MGGEVQAFTTCATVLGSHVADATTRLQELLHPADRAAEAAGNFVAGALVLVVGGEDALASIQREQAHVPDAAACPAKRTRCY